MGAIVWVSVLKWVGDCVSKHARGYAWIVEQYMLSAWVIVMRKNRIATAYLSFSARICRTTSTGSPQGLDFPPEPPPNCHTVYAPTARNTDDTPSSWDRPKPYHIVKWWREKRIADQKSRRSLRNGVADECVLRWEASTVGYRPSRSSCFLPRERRRRRRRGSNASRSLCLID